MFRRKLAPQMVSSCFFFAWCDRRRYDLVSGKNKLQDKVNNDLRAFKDSAQKVEEDAIQAQDKIKVDDDEFAPFRSYHKTLTERLELLRAVRDASWATSPDALTAAPLPKLPEVIKSESVRAAIGQLWSLKNAAVAKKSDECKTIIAQIKAESAQYPGVSMSLLDAENMDGKWWARDIKDACVAFVLCQSLAARCGTLEVSPDMQDVKPLEVCQMELDSAVNQCQTEDDVKMVLTQTLKSTMQKLQNIRNSVSRASGDLTRALATCKQLAGLSRAESF